MHKDVRQMVRRLRKVEGVTVERSKGDHLVVLLNGRRVTTMAATPSCPRWRANTTADLRRGGIALR